MAIRKSRYERAKITMKNKRECYGTVIYEPVPEKNTDFYVMTTDGDRLDLLANEYYSDPAMWWFIAHVNNLKTMNVEVGTYLRIPVDLSDIKLKR
tara:strand:+ start:161 stop:445 length:285 start_codon:yes stop_codon:yes gene_type:complete